MRLPPPPLKTFLSAVAAAVGASAASIPARADEGRRATDGDDAAATVERRNGGDGARRFDRRGAAVVDGCAAWRRGRSAIPARDRPPSPRQWNMRSTTDAAETTAASRSSASSPLPPPPLLATSDAFADRAASAAANRRMGVDGDGGCGSDENGDGSDDTGAGAGIDFGTGNNIREDKGDVEGDDFPRFMEYHPSLLAKYLTPLLWEELKHRRTPTFGTSLEDIVRSGLALPSGGRPSRRTGVLAGDAECYKTFRELFDPIVREYHRVRSFEEYDDPELPSEDNFEGRAEAVVGGDGDGDEAEFDDDEEDYIPPARLDTSQSNLKRRCTIINNSLLVIKTASSAGGGGATATSASPPASASESSPLASVTERKEDYILSTRIRVARSLDGLKFPTTMSRGDRRKVQSLIGDCVQNFRTPKLANGSYLPIISMTDEQNLNLIERHILFDNPNDWGVGAGLSRDWPDGRAIYVNVPDPSVEDPDFMIWVNEEDHLRVICLRKGGDIQGVFVTLMSGVRELESALAARGWQFAQDPRLGYLTSCPTNLGTTMRASVHVRLARLGHQPGFVDMVHRLKLEARGKHGETDMAYSGTFDISNAERLGKSEVHLMNVMVEGVNKLIELEWRLEAGETVNCDNIACG